MSEDYYVNLIRRAGAGIKEEPYTTEALKTLPHTDENLRLLLQERDMRRGSERGAEFYLTRTTEPLTEVIPKPNRRERRQQGKLLQRLFSKLPRSQRRALKQQAQVDREVEKLLEDKRDA